MLNQHVAVDILLVKFKYRYYNLINMGININETDKIVSQLESKLGEIEKLGVEKCFVPLNEGAFALLCYRLEISQRLEEKYVDFNHDGHEIRSKFIRDGEIIPENKNREVYFFVYKY